MQLDGDLILFERSDLRYDRNRFFTRKGGHSFCVRKTSGDLGRRGNGLTGPRAA